MNEGPTLLPRDEDGEDPGKHDAVVLGESEPILRDGGPQQIAALCGPGSYADLRDHFVVPFMG